MTMKGGGELDFIGSEKLTMGIGTATAAMTIPVGTKYVLATVSGGEVNKLHFQCTAQGVSAMYPLIFAAGSGTAQYNPGPLPIPPPHLMSSPLLRRDTTTSAIDYVVFYLR